MTKKLTILFIHHGQGIGGAAMSLLYLTTGLLKRGFCVKVLFLQPSRAVELFRQAGVECIGPIGVSDFSHTVIWWYKWYNIKPFFRAIIDTVKTFLWLAKDVLSQHNPDIVHLNTSSLFAWAMVAKSMGIKVVCHVREPLASGYFGLRRRLVQWALANYCDTIIPISVNESTPWKGSSKVQVVYNAVPDSFSSVDQACQIETKLEQKKSILFLGGMSEQKGTLLLLESFRLLLQSDVDAQLVIAGAFDYEKSPLKSFLGFTSFSRYSRAVKALVDELGPRIKFLGVCTNVPELIQNCDLLVFPATTGHFARPIIEAGFCKKPVVATNLPPLNELVLDGKTGFLTSPDPKDFALKMGLILGNTTLAKKMGTANYFFCKKNFCLTHQINRIASIYLKILRLEKEKKNMLDRCHDR